MSQDENMRMRRIKLNQSSDRNRRERGIENEFVTYVFTLCPTSPPPHDAQRPTFSQWSMHKPVLRPTPTETVCSILFGHAGALRKFLNPGLDLLC